MQKTLSELSIQLYEDGGKKKPEAGEGDQPCFYLRKSAISSITNYSSSGHSYSGQVLSKNALIQFKIPGLNMYNEKPPTGVKLLLTF
jgi:hypothetical protein